MVRQGGVGSRVDLRTATGAATGRYPAARSLCLVLSLLMLLFAARPAAAQTPLFTFAQMSDSQPSDAGDQLNFELVLATIVEGGMPGALLPRPVDMLFFAGDLVDDDTGTFLWDFAAGIADGGVAWRGACAGHFCFGAESSNVGVCAASSFSD